VKRSKVLTERQKAYREFLQSAFWVNLSETVRKKAGRCKRCKSKAHLQAHHKRYPEDWYQTRESDLEVLCRKCHAKVHGLIWDEKLCGPRWMMVFRNDWAFSLVLYRMDKLLDRIYHRGLIRDRDDRFLDKAIRLYPPTKKDSCIAFKVGLVRDMNYKAKTVPGWYAHLEQP
jgi:hypothetical protein